MKKIALLVSCILVCMSVYGGNSNSSRALIKRNKSSGVSIKEMICRLCCCFSAAQKVDASQPSDRSYATTSTSSSSDEDKKDPLINETTIHCNTGSKKDYWDVVLGD